MTGLTARFAYVEEFGRVRLSTHFFMRDFLHSEISNVYRIPNFPSDPELAVEMGSRLCQEVLEPIVAKFGPIQIRSGYRSAKLNEFGAKNGWKCAANSKNAGYHIWDMRDGDGHGGAAAVFRLDSANDHTVMQWTEFHGSFPWG